MFVQNIFRTVINNQINFAKISLKICKYLIAQQMDCKRLVFVMAVFQAPFALTH